MFVNYLTVLFAFICTSYAIHDPSLNIITMDEKFNFDRFERSVMHGSHMRGSVNGQVPILMPAVKEDIVEGQYNVLLSPPNGNRRFSVSSFVNAFEDEANQVLTIFETPRIHGFTAKLTDEGLKRLSRDPKVKLIEADMIVHEYAKIRCSGAESASHSWALGKIHTNRYQQRFSTPQNAGQGIHIFVIDTGVRADHVEFRGRIKPGASMIANETETEDFRGHGTCVAGCAAGAKYGIAKNAYIYPVKVFDRAGRGFTSKTLAGVAWARDEIKSKKLKAIINMSLGGGRSVITNHLINEVYNEGIPVIVAAGNNHLDAAHISPASAFGALAVGATDINNQFAKFSNFGSKVKISAPGLAINCPDIKSTSAYRTNSGTSFSSPYTAGVAAVLYANGVRTNRLYSELIRMGSKNKISSIPDNTPNVLLQSGCNA